MLALAQALEPLLGHVPDWVTGGGLSIAVPAGMQLPTSLPGILQEIALGAYFLWFWVRQGATPGMHVLGIEVLRVSDGEALTFAQALRRFVVLRLCLLVLGLPLLLAFRDSQRQGPHDKVAGSVVVRIPAQRWA
jgi:uncharacterized RDD family membrane protein YckC